MDARREKDFLGMFKKKQGTKSGGYIKKVKDMWDGKDLSVRKEPILISQLKCIEAGLLSRVER